MTRLIDADALKEAIEKNGCKHSHYFDIFDAIDNAPTVAVDNYCLGYQDGLKKSAEKTEGEWIHYLGCGVGTAVCSVCGQLGETKKYCGNCGRRMRGGYS